MTDIYEQLQTEADVEAEKIRPTKEESSLYGARWLTVEELLTEDKGYQQFAVDSAKGGGGGGLNNPVLTINVDATSVPSEVGTLPLYSNNNGVLQIVNGVVNGGSSYSYETLAMKLVYDDESYFGWNGTYYANADITYTSRSLSTSNAVNCEIYLEKTSNFFSVIVEDPTQPASFTLTVS